MSKKIKKMVSKFIRAYIYNIEQEENNPNVFYSCDFSSNSFSDMPIEIDQYIMKNITIGPNCKDEKFYEKYYKCFVKLIPFKYVCNIQYSQNFTTKYLSASETGKIMVEAYKKKLASLIEELNYI